MPEDRPRNEPTRSRGSNQIGSVMPDEPNHQLLQRIEKLERMVSRMQTVTSTQAAELNDAVRRRSRTLCEEYRLPDMEEKVNAKIRRDIKSEFGGLIKETSRDDFNLVRDWIGIWEDTNYLRGLKVKSRKE